VVSSRSSRVALFRATAAHRILTFRGFPTQPAVSSFDERYSLAVTYGLVARFKLAN